MVAIVVAPRVFLVIGIAYKRIPIVKVLQIRKPGTINDAFQMSFIETTNDIGREINNINNNLIDLLITCNSFIFLGQILSTTFKV